MNRKFLIILILTAAVIVGAYFFWQKNSSGSNPGSHTPSLTKLVDHAVISPVISADGNAVWYFNSKGQLFRQEISTSQVTEYPIPLLPSFKNAVWSRQGEDFIAVTADAKYFYDHNSGQYKPLPHNVGEFDWMPDGKRIVYIWKSGDGKTQQLVLANADTSGYKVIRDVLASDFSLSVSLDGTKVLLNRPAGQESANPVYLVDLGTGELRTLMDNLRITGVRWASDTKFAYSKSLDNKNNVGVYDIQSATSIDLGWVTSLERTTLDGQYLYGAVGEGGTDGVWRTEVSNFNSEKVYELVSTLHPQRIFVHGQLVLFINITDGKLYLLS